MLGCVCDRVCVCARKQIVNTFLRTKFFQPVLVGDSILKDCGGKGQMGWGGGK